MPDQNTTANKFSVVNNIVHKFGIMSECPFKPPITTPGNIAGNVNITIRPCAVTCPMCNVYVGALNEDDQKAGIQKHFLQLTCGSGPVMEYIDEPKMEAPTAKITKLHT